MLALFPSGARISAGELELTAWASPGSRSASGRRSSSTPRRRCASAPARSCARRAGALVVYGTKAFPNVALMRLLAEEGLGADVSTLGELAFARRAGIEGERLVVHGNNKSDEELAAAAEAGALVVLDALDEPERAARGGRAPRARAGHTRGRGGDARGDPDGPPRLEVRARPGRRARGRPAARELGLDVAGLHVHVGSQLVDARAHLAAVELLAAFSARCRDELGWTPATVDVGGGFGVRHVPEEPEPPRRGAPAHGRRRRSRASGRRADWRRPD